MDLLRIAARVAGLDGSTLVLDGPLGTGKGKGQYSYEIAVPFGIGGALGRALAQKWGLDAEEERELAAGPVEDLTVGYDVESEHYARGSKPTRDHPGDPEEYELVLAIRSVGGFVLSEDDARAFERAGALRILTGEVEDRHREMAEEEAAMAEWP